MTIATTGMDFLANLVRYRISDLKTIVTNVVQEDVGSSSGSVPETFYTTNLPIASGFDTKLRAGRWLYSAVANEAASNGVRGYVFNTTSGSFLIPSVATPATSGDRIKLTYSWEEEQPYQFRDSEIYLYLGDAITVINSQYYDFGHSFSTDGTNYFISPTIGASDVSAYIYSMYGSYMIKKQLESEGFGDRIYVRDLNITIDTSKGLNELAKSSKELYANVMEVLDICRINGQTEAFAAIDTYSTLPVSDGYYDTNYTKSDEFF